MNSKCCRIITLLMSLLAFSGCSSPEAKPSSLDSSGDAQKHVFYLHGGIIQMQGIDAVSPYFGSYEYSAILDTLRGHGYHVISEARPKETVLTEYAAKVVGEIELLLAAGVSPQDIVVVGASMGAGITLDISIRLENPHIRYAVLGICREGSWQSYLRHYDQSEIQFHGHFLSIYERSDSYGSCDAVIGSHATLSSYEEIALDTGREHGFLYKPYDDWVVPLVHWIENSQP